MVLEEGKTSAVQSLRVYPHILGLQEVLHPVLFRPKRTSTEMGCSELKQGDHKILCEG